MPAQHLGQLAELPSLPTVAIEILKSLNHPESAILQLVDLIQADPALAAKTIEAANSTRYNTRGQAITRLDRAMLLLGKRVVCSLALSISFSQSTMTGGPMSQEFQRFWLESFIRAVACEWCAQRFGVPRSDEAYTIGLLSLIGRLVMLKHCPEEFAECLEQARSRGISVERVEQEQRIVTSNDLTMSLLQRWKFDPLSIKAVQLVVEEREPAALSGLPGLVRCLQIAALLGRVACGSLGAEPSEQLWNSLRKFSLDEEDAESLVRHVLDQVQASETLFQSQPAHLKPFQSLLLSLAESPERVRGTACEFGPRDSAVRVGS